jgi:hypothetical protein
VHAVTAGEAFRLAAVGARHEVGYSTTHKTLRADRRTWRRTQQQDWRQRHHPDLAGPEDETTLIVCDLTLAGIGWNTTADAQLATDAAARAREHRALAREERTTA